MPSIGATRARWGRFVWHGGDGLRRLVPTGDGRGQPATLPLGSTAYEGETNAKGEPDLAGARLGRQARGDARARRELQRRDRVVAKTERG
jgi:hypothetical protein